MLLSVERTIAQLGGGSVFSKQDKNPGFYQIELAKESALLTTFTNPIVIFCFNRLPFRITSAPKHFQKRMSNILGGPEGVVCMMDDILVRGRDTEEHDACLSVVLQRNSSAGVTRNKEKCEFAKTQVTYLGEVISASGIQSEPEKARAFTEMKEPNNIAEVRQFLGVVNQLAELSKALR